MKSKVMGRNLYAPFVAVSRTMAALGEVGREELEGSLSRDCGLPLWDSMVKLVPCARQVKQK